MTMKERFVLFLRNTLIHDGDLVSRKGSKSGTRFMGSWIVVPDEDYQAVSDNVQNLIEVLKRVGCQAPYFFKATGGCKGQMDTACYVCSALARWPMKIQIKVERDGE